MSVKANFTVKIGMKSASASGELSAEVDNREDGYNRGKNEFRPGDPVYFLVYKSKNVTIEATLSSIDSLGGKITQEGTVNIPQVDLLVFDSPDGREGTLSKPCYTQLTYSWLGNNLGTLTLQDDGKTVKLPDLPIPKPSDPPQPRQIGVAQVEFSTTATVYKLSTVDKVAGKSEYDIQVVVAGLAV